MKIFKKIILAALLFAILSFIDLHANGYRSLFPALGNKDTVMAVAIVGGKPRITDRSVGGIAANVTLVENLQPPLTYADLRRDLAVKAERGERMNNRLIHIAARDDMHAVLVDGICRAHFPFVIKTTHDLGVRARRIRFAIHYLVSITVLAGVAIAIALCDTDAE